MTNLTARDTDRINITHFTTKNIDTVVSDIVELEIQVVIRNASD